MKVDTINISDLFSDCPITFLEEKENFEYEEYELKVWAFSIGENGRPSKVTLCKGDKIKR